MNQWNVYLGTNPAWLGVDIYIVQEQPGLRRIITPVELVARELKEGDIAPPSLRLSHEIATPFLKAFAEALDSHGVKTELDATLKGTIKAQAYHLEDLRQLLKLKTP